MRRALHNLVIGIYAFVYAVLGLLLGVTTGFLTLKLVETIFGLGNASPALLQLAVAGWAIFLAVLAPVAYLRSSAGDRLSQSGT
ncbi:hypothetical protein [Jiella pacifica]|jgi:hypothetical protein|uniref:FtsX-like permease family protein n=1 Tax=Jiella pacifica TaxID=2696469 RepID=A0A6N9T5Z7_9HYPH|nr:hypothetical protein [Jiella pacifica]MAU95480.1 hypothetical protein [Fulvimarina sp.]NDW06793.1 hypothetical protein [Jiella pacifica]